MVLDLGKDGQFDLQNCIVENLYPGFSLSFGVDG